MSVIVREMAHGLNISPEDRELKDNNKKILDALKAIVKHKSSVDNDEQTANTFPCTSFGLYNVINDALLQIQASTAAQYAKIQKFSLIYKK